MKHFAAFVILLAGCPDDAASGMPPPPSHVPPSTCVGFGLGFSGPGFVDSSFFSTSDGWRGASYSNTLNPIATGGTSFVSIGGYPWLAPNMWTPFDAVVNGPALVLGDPGPYMSYVTVTGANPGAADLCIYDTDSDTVHDGRRMLVADVASVFATPTNRNPETSTDHYPFARWLLHTGKQRYLGLGLVSANNWRLVDSGLAIEVALDDQPYITGLRDSWDSIEFDAVDARVAHLRATLTNGDQFEASAGLTNEVDHIIDLSSQYSRLGQLQVGGTTVECFETFLGGVHVFASPYQFSAGSNVKLVQTSPSSCITVQGVEVGSGALVVRVDDQVLELPYSVKPAP